MGITSLPSGPICGIWGRNGEAERREVAGWVVIGVIGLDAVGLGTMGLGVVGWGIAGVAWTIKGLRSNRVIR